MSFTINSSIRNYKCILEPELEMCHAKQENFSETIFDWTHNCTNFIKPNFSSKKWTKNTDFHGYKPKTLELYHYMGFSSFCHFSICYGTLSKLPVFEFLKNLHSFFVSMRYFVIKLIFGNTFPKLHILPSKNISRKFLW